MPAKIINIVSGPGAGKTTACSLLFAELKLNHKKVEFVQEFAKTLVWKREFDILNNQHFVSQSQYKLIKSIASEVDYIVTDGSLLHGLYYNRHNEDNLSNIEKTEACIDKWYGDKDFYNIVIFLERGDFEYEQAGRNEDFITACKIDESLKQILVEKKIPFIVVNSSKNAISKMMNFIGIHN